MAMSRSELPEMDRIASIAKEIAGLKQYIRKQRGEIEPEINVDFKLAIVCLNIYKKKFSNDGLSYLEKKFDDLFMNSGYGYEKPYSSALKDMDALIEKVETPALLQLENSPDKKAHYNSFVESEKKEIAAFIQGKTPPLEKRNINSKENIMSDERSYDSADDYLAELKTTVPLASGQQEESKLSPKEEAFREAVINATFQRKVVADAIKNGTLACLPGADGYADTTPAVNIMTPQKPYHAEAQLFLKAFQKQEQNGFPTAEYVTYHQIDKCRESGVDVYVRQGQKGVSLLISEKKEETDDWETKKIRLFNVAQLNSPKLIKDWAEKQIAEQAKKDLEYKQRQYGSGYKPPEAKPKEPGSEIVCSSTEPEKYLGQYLAAVSMGSKFKVSPEQSAEFSEKMVKALYVPMEPRRNEQTGEIKKPPMNKKTGEPITDCFSLEKISRAANKECKEFIRDLRIAAQKQEQPEQKQEQTQSIGGRGM